ncbi:MAG: hypothetical protein V4547_11280 [Bacteroidota bacterium]
MKKKLILIFVIITSAQLSFGQAMIAKLKFEEAEEAYANNNFELAVSKLKDVEALLKSTNPKIRYLQILAQTKIIEKNPLNDWLLLKNTRIMADTYLKDYENLPDNEDKYRDIYKAGESLKKWPGTVVEFSESKGKMDQVQGNTYLKTPNNDRSRNYINGLAEKHKFKNGLNLSEFVNYNSEALELSRTTKHSDDASFWYCKEFSAADVPVVMGLTAFAAFAVVPPSSGSQLTPMGPFKITIAKVNNIVTGYTYVLTSSKDESVINSSYESLKSDIQNNVDAGFIRLVERGVVVMVPEAGMEVSIMKAGPKDRANSVSIAFRSIDRWGN